MASAAAVASGDFYGRGSAVNPPYNRLKAIIAKGIVEMRKLNPFWNMVVLVLSIGLVVFQLWTVAVGVLPDLQQRSIHLGFVLTMTFILVPPAKKLKERTGVPFYDIVLAVISAAATIYLLFNYYNVIYNPLQWLGGIDIFFAVALSALVLEASRRTVGLIFPGLAVFFFIYAITGPVWPGVWGHKRYSLDLIFQTLYHSTNGIWGQMVSISAVMLAMFGIFGAMLSITGGAETFIKIGQNLTGRRVGGQGKVALIASGLFGMISGSAMANVVATGTFTIPLMKKSGYDNEWSAAISAVGSTGGTIMPPMMGAGAFIMAQLIGIPYLNIAIAGFVPAVLYYMGAYVAVHYLSKKKKIGGGDLEKQKVAISEYFIILLPIAVFVFLLVQYYTAAFAAFFATAVGFVTALYFAVREKKTVRALPGETWKLFKGVSVSGASSIVSMASLLAGSQITISLISLTGFGVKLSNLIVGIGRNNLFACLLLSMLVCIILGMGLPATASYVLGAAVLAPALTTLGVNLLVAHLFVFYFAGFSTITPPVCAAVYLSSGIAKSNWFRTGLLSCMIALPAFVVPYTFVYDTSLLLQGSLVSIVFSIVTACIGVFAVGIGVAGYLKCNMNLFWRVIIVIAGIMMVIPNIWLSLIGLVIFAVVYISNHLRMKKLSMVGA